MPVSPKECVERAEWMRNKTKKIKKHIKDTYIYLFHKHQVLRCDLKTYLIMPWENESRTANDGRRQRDLYGRRSVGCLVAWSVDRVRVYESYLI